MIIKKMMKVKVKIKIIYNNKNKKCWLKNKNCKFGKKINWNKYN